MSRIVKLTVFTCLFGAVAFAAVPKVGDRAPQFSLPSSTGTMVALKDFVGKSNVVLVFYRGYW